MSKAPALLVMAGGIGSRYGGLKQIDPVGPHGEIILDYAVYDALQAGFEKVIFLIRREIEDVFREKIGRTIETRVETAYAFQDVNDVPAGVIVPPERKKPWGTGHAVLTCRPLIDRDFAVINADDYYGPGAFTVLAEALRTAQDHAGIGDYSMAGYTLRNTLSEHGSVARGVCQVDGNGMLTSVLERTRIEPDGDDARYTEDGEHWHPLSGDTRVSMNMWGFTPGFVDELAARFPKFFKDNADRLPKAEFFLPEVVNAMLREGQAQVRVLPTGEKWHGVTYPADRPIVQAALQRLTTDGRYTTPLWK